MMKKLFIFDLDGTLINTIADLAESTNQALRILGFPCHEIEEYKYFVGNGIMKLFERALPEDARTDENIQKVHSLFVPYYDIHNTDRSKVYENMPDVLKTLQDNGALLAVASNKYQRATSKLVSYYYPDIHFSVVFGQRDNVPTKPDPTIVFNILKITNINKKDTIYLGDSCVDMQTAKAAGVDACGVTWGFRPKEELIKEQPLYIIDKRNDILSFL